VRILAALLLSLVALSLGMTVPVRAQSDPAQAWSSGSPAGQEREYTDDDDPVPPDDQAPPTGRGDGPNADQRRRHFEEFRMMKMIEVLDLTDQQEAPFTTAYQAMRKQQRSLDDNKRDALEKLSHVVKRPKPDRLEVNRLIDQVVGYETEKRDLNHRFLDEMRKILTPEQAGRLVLFAERFDSTVFQRLQAMRQGMGRGMGKGMRHSADSTHDSGQRQENR
jgi:Spy/CpxP family protein refolding chaperone